MKNFPNANQLSGRAIGSIFFACFGTGWLFLALAAKQIINPATVAGTLVGMVTLLLTAAYLLHRARRWPRVPDDPAIGRAFGWVNAIQWIAIAVIAFTLGKLHLDAYTPSAVAGIVGLAPGGQKVPQVAMGLENAGIDFQCPSIMGDGLVGLAATLQGDGQELVGVDVGGIDLQGPATKPGSIATAR